MSTGKLIIQHLRKFIPQFTDLFSTKDGITTITNAAGTVTITTSPDHGLSTGNSVTISGSTIPIDISTLTRSGKIGTAETSSDHDLTEDYVKNVTIIGAIESEFNGTFKLLTVPNRRKFTFTMVDSGPTVATGSPQLLEDHRLGYNGLFPVTVTAADTFTVSNTAGGLGTDGNTTNSFIHKNIRISGDATIDRLIQSYTERNIDKICGFIVLNDGVFNKDRRMDNDATSIRTLNDNFQIRLITSINFYVFVPTDKSVQGSPSISGRAARDLMESLRVPLYRSLMRLRVPSPFVSTPYSVLTGLSHGVFQYNTAYYIHQFEFEYTEDLVANVVGDGPLGSGGDTLPETENIAFRDITNRVLNSFEEIIKDDDIDLDEDPLP